MHIVVTLAEKDYLYGACVLYNSLLRNGFQGLFVIGFRHQSSLPTPARIAFIQDSANVVWIELETPLHFTNFKPQFMLQVLERYPDCTAITYIDPDVVLNGPFHWIASWAEGGPTVCADVSWWMPAHHPTRRQWILLTGLKVHHLLDFYFNGGFVSVRRDDLAFLDLWTEIMTIWGSAETRLDTQGEIQQWRDGGRWLPFMAVDQDALNVAVMCWEGSITTLGPDVMGFAGYGELPHAVGANKPWQRNYLLEALRGSPPRYVDRVFWAYADSPLTAFPRPVLRIKRAILAYASALSRFYCK